MSSAKGPLMRDCYVTGNLVILKDDSDYLWVLGMNYESKIASDGAIIDVKPLPLNIKLNPGEKVDEAYHKTDIFAIMTRSKTASNRLFVAEVCPPGPYEDYGLPEIRFRPEPFTDVLKFSVINRTIIFAQKKGGISAYNFNFSKAGAWLQNSTSYVIEPIYDSDGNLEYASLHFDMPGEGSTIGLLLNHVHIFLSKVKMRKTFAKKKAKPQRVKKNRKQVIQDNIILCQQPDVAEEAFFKYMRFNIPMTSVIKFRTYVNHTIPKFVAMIDGGAYIKKVGEKTLAKISDVPGIARIVNKPMDDYRRLVFVDTRAIRNGQGGLLMQLDRPINPRSIKGLFGSDIVVSFTADHHAEICFKVNGEAINIVLNRSGSFGNLKNGIIAYNNGCIYIAVTEAKSSIYAKLINKPRTTNGKIIYVYQIEHQLQIHMLATNSDICALFTTTEGEIKRIEFPQDNTICSWRISLAHRTSPMISSNLVVRFYPIMDKKKNRVVRAGSCDLETFTILLDTVPQLTVPNIQGGEDALNNLISGAVMAFEADFIIKDGNRPMIRPDVIDFNREWIEHVGMALHAIVIITRSPLSIRLPFSVLVAIKGRKPTVSELEYYARRYDESALQQIQDTKTNIETYYQELSIIVGYNAQQKCRASKILANAITCYTDIINLPAMNIPTLDCYLSGPIDN